MESFNLVLKNERPNRYDRVAWFIIAINFFLFIYIGLSTQEKGTKAIFIIGAALVLICALIQYFLVSVKRDKASPYVYAAFFVCFFTWLQQGIYWAPLICAVLSILYQISKKPPTVMVSKGEVIYRAIFQRRITWDQLNNLILKDGLLTIDFRNDKIIQAEINANPPVNEKEFNEFCREQLNRQKPGSGGTADTMVIQNILT